MWYPVGIAHLYSKVLFDDILQNDISESDVQLGIQQMTEAYRPYPNSLLTTHRRFANFNVKAFRCAYLHKYAPFHTALVYEMLSRAIFQSGEVCRRLVKYLHSLKICSLGSGPGTDLIGVLSALHHQFGFFHSTATLVDIMSDWQDTFSSIIHELKIGDFGTLGQSMQVKYFNWSFVTADLLEGIDRKTRESIECADIITMIKFVSATACSGTASMIERIFKCMKPGALVFFIDNASGGFRELVNDAAIKYKLNTIFGPLNFENYTNNEFNVTRFGYVSCHSTTVTVQILMKSHFACISDTFASTVHYPSYDTTYESSIGFKDVDNFEQSVVMNGHNTILTDVNQIRLMKKAKKLKVLKETKSLNQISEKTKRTSSNPLNTTVPGTKSQVIENKNNKIYSPTDIKRQKVTQQPDLETLQISLKGTLGVSDINKIRPNVLDAAILQNRTMKYVSENENKLSDSHHRNQLPRLLSENQRHTSAAKNQIMERNFEENSSLQAKKDENFVPYDESNVSSSKFIPYAMEKQQKQLKEVNLESSTQSGKPLWNSYVDAIVKKHTVNSAGCVNTLRFNECRADAESINKLQFPNIRERETGFPVRESNGKLNDQIQNKGNSVVVGNNIHKPSHFNSSANVGKPLLKSARSPCSDPSPTEPPQPSYNSTGSILRNSSSIATHQSIPPSDVNVNSPDDHGCSCCVIS